jgi:hypothetical protein
VFDAEHFACSRDAGLDFIGDEEDVVFCAERTDFGEVIVIWDDNSSMSIQCSIEGVPSLALDWFNDETCDAGAMSFKGFFEVFNVIISNDLSGRGIGCTDKREIRTILIATFGVGGHGYYANRPAVEVAFDREHDSLARWNAFLHVSPSTGQFDPGFHRFGTRVPGRQLPLQR